MSLTNVEDFKKQAGIKICRFHQSFHSLFIYCSLVGTNKGCLSWALLDPEINDSPYEMIWRPDRQRELKSWEAVVADFTMTV